MRIASLNKIRAKKKHQNGNRRANTHEKDQTEGRVIDWKGKWGKICEKIEEWGKGEQARGTKKP